LGILHTKKEIKDEKTIDFHLVNSKNLLLIFTRNPELGKCKTRLAAKVGDDAALEIYKFLLNHTAGITKNLYATKAVYYSEEIWENDIWDPTVFDKKLQEGADLGERMANAFKDGFEKALDGGYYLLGMKKYKEDLFKNKDWGTASVLEATLKNLKQEGLQLLTEKNDVDHFEDIKDIEAFGPYLKHMPHD